MTWTSRFATATALLFNGVALLVGVLVTWLAVAIIIRRAQIASLDWSLLARLLPLCLLVCVGPIVGMWAARRGRRLLAFANPILCLIVDVGLASGLGAAVT